jgi:hypothetical protein
MINKTIGKVALAFALAAGPVINNVSAQDRLAAFEFKSLQTADAPALLPIHILVPDAGNGVRRVSDRSTFYDHERFKVAVQPKRSGHVYVFSRNSQGDVQLLFPLHDDGDSYVTRNDRVNVPGDGWFRFDAEPGQEELILLQSPTPVADFEQAGENGGSMDRDLFEHYEHLDDAPQGAVVRHVLLDHQPR